MLKHLYIRNYALIDELDIDFPDGFSVVTGETGAGKSIILGAIGLLLGNRADVKAIKPGARKCVVEAVFDVAGYGLEPVFAGNDIDYDDGECIVRRELGAAGKSRAFVNDSPVPVQVLKQLGERLVDIHSQHQNLLLRNDDFQLGVVDVVAHSGREVSSYRKSFDAYRRLDKELAALKSRIATAMQNEEFIRFQYDELKNARLSECMQDELEQESAALTHSEDIKIALLNADNSLNGDDNGAVAAVGSAAGALHSIEDVYPKVRELAQRLDSARIELGDIASDVSANAGNVDFDPARLDIVNQQLDAIYSLEQKHRVSTVAQLIAIRDDLERQLEGVEDGSGMVADMERKVAAALGECKKEAAKLTALRTKAATVVEKEMSRRLAPLGMPNVRFKVRIQPKELSPDGADKVSFLFSANKNAGLRHVSDVASGGEIARVMLSLKAMTSGVVNLPTIIFDEIDTGVSGAIAGKMAQVMKEMADAGRQVISITHLPQIAALGSAHYKVEKHDTDTGTTSIMRRLSDDERVTEIASMLSADNITDAALQNARDLLQQAFN